MSADKDYHCNNRSCSIKDTLNFISLFRCFDWVLASVLTHILFPCFTSHVNPKHIFHILTVFEMSHLSYHCRIYYTGLICISTDKSFYINCFFFFSSLLYVCMTSSDDPHISIGIFWPHLMKTAWPFLQNPVFIPAAC